jgi:hypothetical protein
VERDVVAIRTKTVDGLIAKAPLQRTRLANPKKSRRPLHKPR